MVSDHRSAAEIEREIEAERSALTRTLDEIQDRLSFEALSSDIVDRVRDSSGDIGRTVVRTVRDNPVPFALTALGLTWLMASQRSGTSSRRSSVAPGATYSDDVPRWDGRASRDLHASEDPWTRRESATLYDAGGRSRTYRAPRRHDPALGGRAPMGDDRSFGGDEPSRWDRAREAASDAGDGIAGSVGRGRDRAVSGMESAAERTRSGAQSLRDDAQSHAGHLSDAVRRRARGAYASAAELRQRITDGTEDLSEQARARVLAARTRAWEAQLRAEHYTSRGREKAADLYEDQPLVAGALAMAVGAALGGLLPRTSQEDDAFGAYRDQVFDEAERVYHDERSKLGAVARETADEARDVAREVADTVKDEVRKGVDRTGDAARSKLSEVEGKAKEAAERVADTAKSEADKQDLGQR